jgi:hypothetical protein
MTMWRSTFSCAAMTLAFALPVHAASLLLHALPGEHSNDLEVLERLSRAYGLDLVDATVQAQSLMEPRTPIAAVTTARFRAVHGKDALSATLRQPWASKLPVIVIGEGIPTTSRGCTYEVTASAPFGNAVRGMPFPCIGAGKRGVAFRLPQADGPSEPLVTLIPEAGEAAVREAAATRTTENGRFVFRIASVGSEPLGAMSLVELLHARFGAAGSLAVILAGLAGERAWHVDTVYANFTIDDPWLREPYGGLSYSRELDRMERFNFHTTIGFVPWNFGRSDPAVAGIVRAHPQRFSIAVHGNNHDHEEFGEHNSIETSDKNIRQALARMDEFSRRTGVPYDRVMVFPQQVASDEVLGLLRKHQFACTVNLQNRRDLRLDPGARGSLWEGFVRSGQGAPSLKRELPTTPMTYLAVLALLGRPLLLHAHQDYYLDHDFTEIARRINAMSIPIQWAGLGQICGSLWLRRLAADGHYEVVLYGTRSRVRNPAGERRLFRFMQPVSAAVGVRSIEVDGRSVPFKAGSDSITFEAELEGSSTALVVTRYADEIVEEGSRDGTPSVRREPRVAALRLLSDFRDTVLAHYELGRGLTTLYYDLMKGSYRAIDAVLIAVLALLAIAGGGIVLRLFRMRRIRSARPRLEP